MLAALDSHRLRITVSGSSQPIAMSVEGLLRTVMTGGNTELMDFGTPKPLTLEPDPRGAHVSFQRVADDRTLVSAPLLIDGLSLNRIDETLETTRTELAVVSTIVSGTVRFDAPVGPERTIGAGERLRFGDPGGEIRALELAGGNLRLRFQGRVRHMESCTSDDDCENWMPATFESLMARRRPWVLALGAAYILGVLALTRWRHGSSRRYLLFALAFGMGGTTRAHAQENLRLQDPEETVRQLVVRVESEVGFGSGIIVGTRSDTLFIVTANHVVRRGPVGADSVDVRFRWQPDGSVRATLLPNADDSLDLALLVVSPLSSVPPDPGARAGRAGIDIRFDGGALPFDRLGDLDALGRGDPIYLLGHPNGLPWRINTIPERFIGRRGESLDFESNLLARGHSGGALLNEDREVIGLLKSDQAPYGEAVSLYAIARRLEAWGYPVDLRLRAPQLEAGAGRTCVLTSRGETRCQGFDNRYESGPIEFEMRLEQLSITDDHACGIAAGGRAFCIGNNSNAQLGDGTTISRYDAPSEVAGGLIFETISAGSGHSCGLVSDGDVYCWGLAEGGQLGTWFDEDRPTPVRVPTTERFLSVSTSWQYSCGLAASGLAYCWGAVANASSNRGTPITRQAGDLGFVSLTTGTYQICGVATTGAAFCWGFNDDAQLGIGTVDDDFHEEPRPVSGNHSFKSISSGVSHTCGVTTDGDAWCWGLNRQGQLGNGSTDNSSVPVRVKGELVFEKLSAGHLHTCGLTTDGTIWCWGDNGEGGVGPSGQPVHTEPYRVMNVPEDERRPWRQ
jgi:alpha-tubulin suppressor-like RCC1 family protein/S1-C subfamily serine protease